jgi:hypothetical protein
MMILLPDPRDQKAPQTSLLSYNELLQHECVQGPAISKAKYDSRHLLGIRQGRLRIQRVRLCLQ